MLSEVAEPSGSQLSSLAAVESAVAGPYNEVPSPPAELAPVEPAPGVEPAPAVEPATVGEASTVVEPEVQKHQVEAPDCPKEAALKSLKPPAPAPPIDVGDEDDVNATAVAATAVAAQHKIEATLLTLARQIRQPRSYVGYSAFILMGLRMKCQPCVWEGSSFIDLLEVFAPWA